MSVYVALLRGINVGGSGRLVMSDLAGLCCEAGLNDVRTYIQSGNVVFSSPLRAVEIKTRLETALAAKMSKSVAVVVRSGAQLQALLRRNPFPDVAPNKVLVLFLDKPLAKETFAGLVAPGGEEVTLDGREVFVHYPDGMGRSKLKLPLVGIATGRNLNTVARLAAMASELTSGT